MVNGWIKWPAQENNTVMRVTKWSTYGRMCQCILSVHLHKHMDPVSWDRKALVYSYCAVWDGEEPVLRRALSLLPHFPQATTHRRRFVSKSNRQWPLRADTHNVITLKYRIHALVMTIISQKHERTCCFPVFFIELKNKIFWTVKTSNGLWGIMMGMSVIL